MYKCVLFFSFAIFFLSCFKEDTCNTKLGTTFKSIGFNKSMINEEGNMQVVFDLQTLDILPDAYFESYHLIRSKNDLYGNPIVNSSERFKEIVLSKSTMNMTILQDSLPAISTVEVLFLYLSFSDRKEYINCTHPGSSDRYYLDLEIKVERITSDSILVSAINWQENLIRGGY